MEQSAHILTATVRKAGRGDDTARSLLYNRFSRKMFSICIRMTGNRPDAEDLLQDCFIAAFNNLHQLKEAHLFEPWLRSIVVHECVRFAKKRLSLQQWDEQDHDSAEAETIDWLKTISFEQIHEAIKNLPHGCREVFNLYVLEDYTHQQIATALNISISTSKSQYHRARQLLKERLRKQFMQYG